MEKSTFSARWNIANDPDTPPENLEELSKFDWLIRNAVAKNRNTSKETLRKLAYDPNPTVRMNVAGNPHTPEDVLHDLSNDMDKMVRIGVSRNPETEIETVQKLAEDRNYTVRKNAIESGRV
ncbi:MAG: hypothetical protein AB1638_11830 [Nitrospirota bacterium]